MAAVMAERFSTQWQGLEPEGMGHDLLCEWAPWVREDRDPASQWAVKPRIDRGYHGDPPDRVNRVDKIVARIRLDHPRYYSVIARYYLDGLLPHQMTGTLGATEGWVRSMILAACGLVEIRYREAVNSHSACWAHLRPK